MQSQTRPLSIAIYLLAGICLFVIGPIAPHILPASSAAASIAFCGVFAGLLIAALALLNPHRSRGLIHFGALAVVLGFGAALYDLNTTGSQPQLLSAWLLTSNRVCLAGMLVLTGAGLMRYHAPSSSA